MHSAKTRTRIDARDIERFKPTRKGKKVRLIDTSEGQQTAQPLSGDPSIVSNRLIGLQPPCDIWTIAPTPL